MRVSRLSIVLMMTIAICTVACAADNETVLYNFQHYRGTDGAYPYTGVIFDAAGNLYGTTGDGGVSSQATFRYGTVFELSPNGSGGWTEKVLHTFGRGTDGRFPSGNLSLDGAGNLYGTTASNADQFSGTVFELSPNAGGDWTETVLYRFRGGTDGAYPNGKLIFDTAGNLYGVTADGGAYGYGMAFELSPSQGGGWTETVLHNFGNGTDGQNPYGLVMDSAGNLYGTTALGGVYNNCYEGLSCGTVFELSPQAGGGWSETVLHNFGDGTDGRRPFAGVIMDGTGNLYGTTDAGGIYNNCDGFDISCGTVFRLAPNEGGGWTETVLHSFGNGTDGQNPDAGLIFDGTGNLYGTTQSGGSYLYFGTVFKLSPSQGGDWIETVLHSLGNGNDGAFPYYAGVVLDEDGNLYGTTASGGTQHTGTVFKIGR